MGEKCQKERRATVRKVICPNCGADEFFMKDGYKICSYCDSKFIPSIEDKPRKGVTIALDDDVQVLLEKCKREPFRARKYANLILEIDPDNEEALKYL